MASPCPGAWTGIGSDRRSWRARWIGAAGASSGCSPSARITGGKIPTPSSYIWRNLPLDVGHVLAYFVAHEAHHRGQIVLAARELGYRLPLDVTNGLWQWTTRAREAKERDQ